jgi:hypothetical protein
MGRSGKNKVNLPEDDSSVEKSVPKSGNLSDKTAALNDNDEDNDQILSKLIQILSIKFRTTSKANDVVIKSKRKAISQVTPFEKFKEAVENYHEMITEELKPSFGSNTLDKQGVTLWKDVTDKSPLFILKAFVLSLYDVRPTSVFAETAFSRERLLKPPVRNRALVETIEKLLLIKPYILQKKKDITSRRILMSKERLTFQTLLVRAAELPIFNRKL